MNLIELLRDADRKLDHGEITIGEYEKMIAPLKDAVPVRHGHWVRWYEEVYDSFGVGYAPHYKCSECDTEYDQYDAMRMNYCPNCGVKLDGKDGDT